MYTKQLYLHGFYYCTVVISSSKIHWKFATDICIVLAGCTQRTTKYGSMVTIYWAYQEQHVVEGFLHGKFQCSHCYKHVHIHGVYRQCSYTLPTWVYRLKTIYSLTMSSLHGVWVGVRTTNNGNSSQIYTK